LLEQAYFISQLVLVAIALAAAVIGHRQLRALRAESDARTRIARADFLLQLDQMFESEAIAESRLAFSTLLKKVEAEVAAAHAQIAVGSRTFQTEVAKAMARELEALHSDKMEDYQKIMKLCGFFETLGVVVARGYVSDEDATQLYGGAILRAHDATHLHIEKRQQSMPPGYLANFLSLAAKLATRG